MIFLSSVLSPFIDCISYALGFSSKKRDEILLHTQPRVLAIYILTGFAVWCRTLFIFQRQVTVYVYLRRTNNISYCKIKECRLLNMDMKELDVEEDKENAEGENGGNISKSKRFTQAQVEQVL